MRLAVLSLLMSLPIPLGAQTLSWEKVQQSRDFQNARDALSQSLPDLAIPRLQKLLLLEELDATAKASLLTLLGEAEVRDGQSAEALVTLADPALKEFSPAHLWRSHAHSQLGEYEKAIEALTLIDRSSMLSEANFQIAVLQAALGNPESAIDHLVPLLDTKDSDLSLRVAFQLVALSLQNGELDRAQEILDQIGPETSGADQGMLRYLRGRLYLARKDREAAVRTFQSLFSTPIDELRLPGPIFHAATLSLADSLALENNFEVGITSLLETLERFPNSPRIIEIFARLEEWSIRSEGGLNTIVKKLNDWIPQPLDAPKTEATEEDPPSGSLAVTPGQRGTASRAIYSLHLLATLNLRSADPIPRALARKQFAQLKTLAGPKTQALVSDSLIQLGLASLSEGKAQEALEHFESLRDFSNIPEIEATANALIGKAALVLKDTDAASQAYLDARKIAADADLYDLELASALNAGIALLATGRGDDLEKIADSLDNPEASAALLLERGLSLADQENPDARDLLSRFITEYPQNPRHPEGLLALAESALQKPTDTALATNQIAILKSQLSIKEPELFSRLILVQLKLCQLTKPDPESAEFAEWAELVAKTTSQASDFLAKTPRHSFSPRLLFELGQTHRKAGEPGPANLSFEKFLDAYPGHELSDAARFLSALSAMAMASGVESAEANALESFQELAKGEGPLATESAIARASLLIDADQQKVALEEVESLLKSDKLVESDRHRLLILAADAAGQTGNYEQAISYYDQLLARPDLPLAMANRAYFQRGQAFEQLGKNGEALESYLIVVNRQTTPDKSASLEWQWFDRCGIEGALDLLQRAKRWEAAIKLCDRLARSGSPRADDAAASAKRIGLEQMIYRGR